MNLNLPLKHSSSDGFTLLEVLISIMLLVVISLSIYQATTETYRIRDTLVVEGDFYNSIRLSMGIMERDIMALYSPTPLIPEKKAPPKFNNGGFGVPAAPSSGDDAQLAQLLQSDAGQNSEYWLGTKDLTGIRLSRFSGSDSKMTFISASHQRLYKNSPESEFAKISYELQEDKSEDAVEGGKVLVKGENPDAFDTANKKETALHLYPLLHGVKSIAIRYYRRDRKAWEKSWDTGSDSQSGKYPDLIEVKIQVVGKHRLRYDGIYVFRPELPFEGLDATL